MKLLILLTMLTMPMDNWPGETPCGVPDCGTGGLICQACKIWFLYDQKDCVDLYNQCKRDCPDGDDLCLAGCANDLGDCCDGAWSRFESCKGITPTPAQCYGIDDLNLVLQYWGNIGFVCENGDYNCDGHRNLDDLLLVLNGRCPE